MEEGINGTGNPQMPLTGCFSAPRYFKKIYNASGLPQMVEKYGDWFTYDKNPRAKIFQRNQTLVQDMDSMIRLMRSGVCGLALSAGRAPELPTVFPAWRSLPRLLFPCRYNNFPKDPLSRCQRCNPPQNGENSIAARSDLNPPNGTYPFGALRQRPHGGTDMKVKGAQASEKSRGSGGRPSRDVGALAKQRSRLCFSPTTVP